MSAIIKVSDLLDRRNKKWGLGIYLGTWSLSKFEIHITPPNKRNIFYFPIIQGKIDWKHFEHNICLVPIEIREYADNLVKRYKSLIAFC